MSAVAAGLLLTVSILLLVIVISIFFPTRDGDL